MNTPAGPRVHTRITRPDRALIERFRRVKTEVLTLLLAEPLIMDRHIKPLAARDWQVVGPALTVAPDGTDMLMAIVAAGIAEPGDVIVVAAGGDTGNGHAAWGGGLTLSAKNRDVAGVIVDGLAMNTQSILSRDLPVFCRGTTHRYRLAARPGSVNVPVLCGGIQVNPGDLILADADGVLVIPQESLAAIIDAAEERTAQLIRNGERLATERSTLFAARGGPSLVTKLGVAWLD